MMFQVLERDGQLQAVYSKADLEYLTGRGWKPRVEKVAAILKPPEVKRKYTRKAKA